jgi:hypothetical protein
MKVIKGVIKTILSDLDFDDWINIFVSVFSEFKIKLFGFCAVLLTIDVFTLDFFHVFIFYDESSLIRFYVTLFLYLVVDSAYLYKDYKGKFIGRTWVNKTLSIFRTEVVKFIAYSILVLLLNQLYQEKSYTSLSTQLFTVSIGYMVGSSLIKMKGLELIDFLVKNLSEPIKNLIKNKKND